MMRDVFLLADPFLDILGRDDEGRMIKISEGCDNIQTFLKLSDDYVLKSIQNSSQPELEPARALVRRIASRNLYKLLGEVVICGTSMDVATCESQINNLMKEERKTNLPTTIREGDIVVTRKNTRSLEGQNLLEKVIFFDKKNRLVLVPVAEVMEAAPCYETLLVMCKRDQMDSMAIEDAKYLFKKWLIKHKA